MEEDDIAPRTGLTRARRLALGAADPMERLKWLRMVQDCEDRLKGNRKARLTVGCRPGAFRPPH